MNVAFIIGFVIVYFLQSTALLAFLWIMIKIQKFDYAWLPLIGSAFLAGGLDLIPIVGHFIAVPVLYICIWKITRSTIFPDATFTVVLSYALMRCLGWILLTVGMSNFHATAMFHNDDETNEVMMVTAPATNPPPEISKAANKIAEKISIKGISRGAGSTMATIQYGSRDYILSLNEAVSISTEEGLVTVKLVEAGDDSVTLTVRGEKVKYSLK
ncbi:MAG TPA: hypothetical protein VFV23_14250 [Verrucomicrobiae bacterium]|nr:hypothetical protein [Verrucomicrobiae bacterium]